MSPCRLCQSVPATLHRKPHRGLGLELLSPNAQAGSQHRLPASKLQEGPSPGSHILIPASPLCTPSPALYPRAHLGSREQFFHPGSLQPGQCSTPISRSFPVPVAPHQLRRRKVGKGHLGSGVSPSKEATDPEGERCGAGQVCHRNCCVFWRVRTSVSTCGFGPSQHTAHVGLISLCLETT